jgi:hypothetical protein
MDNILEPNEQFDFSLLSLGQPSSIQGGAYFTKLQYKENPFYIETPKSLTRQGFVKNGKKMVVDLMFDNTNEEFIHWMENLETKCQDLIHQKGDSWFQNKLEMNDIESAFNSPMKIYKSGKFYLVRVNVKMNYGTNNPYIKIYNENEIPLTIEDVNTETNLISILEIQGIKFTTRSFQIEMEVKQMMVLNTYEIFETCVIRHKSNTEKKNSNDVGKVDPDIVEVDKLDADLVEVDKNEVDTVDIDKEDKIKDTLHEAPFVDEQKNDVETVSMDESSESPSLTIDIDTSTSNTDFDETPNKENSSLEKMNENELTEVLLEDIENLESIQLKKPNQVYYEIYKEARRKAKEAKKNAMIAFLEAKNIKKTYMLEDLDDSDDEEEYEDDEDEEDEEDDYEKEMEE